MPGKPVASRQQDQRKMAAVKPRILLADDHTLVAAAVAKLFERQFEVVGRVSDGRQLLDYGVALQPDVVILDLSMPTLNGMDAGRQLKDLLPSIKIVVLTVNEDPDVAAEILRTWGSGFVLKKSASRELLKAVREVLKGNTYFAVGSIPKLDEKLARNIPREQTDNLTLRQREVLQLLAEGRTMKEAANVLGVTARTVAFHKYRIMRECGLKNNSDLVRLAIKAHMIPKP
jgi:DNA-binding NarL/FixJ family response regulator